MAYAGPIDGIVGNSTRDKNAGGSAEITTAVFVPPISTPAQMRSFTLNRSPIGFKSGRDLGFEIVKIKKIALRYYGKAHPN
jgi:hypothetical protein